MDRLRQSRELLRHIAMLLSADQPLSDVLRELGALLAENFEAGVRVSYAGEDAETRRYEYGDVAEDRPVVSVPVSFSGLVLGDLTIVSPAPLDADDVALLETCAVYLGARLHDEQSRVRTERLERLALTDSLTTVSNRRAFDQVLAREWSRARRNGSPLALLMLDIDHFKLYNDAYGHRAGDQCLRSVAAAASSCLRRPGDFFGRYGGEEFVALLPETGLDGALIVAEAMRGAVERLAMAHGSTAGGRITVSVGAAQCMPKETVDSGELVGSADAALYAAKSDGRNRVVGAHALAAEKLDARGILGNLPSRSTRFVGHTNEVARLTSALERNVVVTVTGAGGVGKTRIAIEIARRLAGYFPDGTWFLDLAMLDDPNDFLPFACEVLRTVAPLARDEASLASALRDKRALVVMDNCEHVIPQAAELARTFAQHCPEMRLLATSREPLRVKGSVTHRLGSLALEDAVELFVERARAAGIWLGDERRAIIAAIVQQLDAIPLAIELAAPQLRNMTPEELLRRLDDRLQVLGMSNRGAPSRQQTLEALLDWSHRLLDEKASALFRRLAVFTGGFTLEAAMHVCADEEQLNEAATGEALADLVSKSLVTEESALAGVRFRMLEITRIYAQGLLVESGEFDAAAYAHVRFFTTLAARFEGTLEATPVTYWRKLVSLDGQNFRAALSLAIDAGDVDSIAAMCQSLHYWLWEHGAVQASDLTRRIAAILATTLKPSVEAPMRLALAALVRRSDRPRAYESARRSLELYRALGDDLHVADALRSTVTLEHETMPSFDAGLEGEMHRYVELMLDAGSTLRAAELLNNLGVFYAQSLDESRLHDALECFERAGALLEARNDSDRCGRVVGNTAGIAFLLGDAELAARRSRRAVELFDRSEEGWSGGRQWANHGYYLLACGRVDEARSALRRGIGVLRDLGDRLGLAGALEYMAQLYHRTGNDRLAARLIGFANATFGPGVARQARESEMLSELQEAVRANLGDEAYNAETHRGAGTTVEEIVRETESA
ncbi:MAG TPA: diguanylate cyclase [Verrucomicrobiae bacterium]|nr:diguanylate cyclase [Verrucomicrobiae bacterium]